MTRIHRVKHWGIHKQSHSSLTFLGVFFWSQGGERGVCPNKSLLIGVVSTKKNIGLTETYSFTNGSWFGSSSGGIRDFLVLLDGCRVMIHVTFPEVNNIYIKINSNNPKLPSRTRTTWIIWHHDKIQDSICPPFPPSQQKQGTLTRSHATSESFEWCPTNTQSKSWHLKAFQENEAWTPVSGWKSTLEGLQFVTTCYLSDSRLLYTVKQCNIHGYLHIIQPQRYVHSCLET